MVVLLHVLFLIETASNAAQAKDPHQPVAGKNVVNGIYYV